MRYYQKRINHWYHFPVIDEHFRMGDVAKKPRAPVQSMTQEELLQFFAELRRGRCPIFYQLALAQFSLGLRISEACGLNWDAIDFKNKMVRIAWSVTWDQFTWEPTIKERPKNGKIRILALPEILAEELKRMEPYRDPDVALVFHWNGRPLNRQSVSRLYNRVFQKLGLKHLHGTHTLRRSAASLLTEATGDFFSVSRLLDHSSVATTMKYIMPMNSAKMKMAAALDSVLTNLPGYSTSPKQSSPSQSPAKSAESAV